MTSVERAIEYTRLPSEAPLKSGKQLLIGRQWPEKGEIVARDLTLSYSDEGDVLALKNVNFVIKPKEKVCIISYIDKLFYCYVKLFIIFIMLCCVPIHDSR